MISRTDRWMWALRWATGLCALLFVLAVSVVAGALHLLRPGPGEWAVPARIGPWRGELSGPALLRIATNPMLLERIDGRIWDTPVGPVSVHAGAAAASWRAVCAPCSLQADSLGRASVQLPRVEVTWQRDVRMDLVGEFVLSSSAASALDVEAARGAVAATRPTSPPAALTTPLHGRWRLRNQVQQVELSLSLAGAPLASALGLVADRVPELAHAKVDGRLNLELQWSWPSRLLSVKPRLEGFRVAGLGTEALLDALPSGPAAPRPANQGAWLARAVLAAEDPRFFEHTGFDAVDLGTAFSSAPRDGSPRRNPSTLSQQLARLILSGDDASPVRKLRELLHAVELDRTLGKARTLGLYLALAPWGAGECGAAAATTRYLGQEVHELDPLDAAWLASLLHNPDAELAQMARTGQPNALRVRWIVEHLRPLNRAKRRALLDALDDWTLPPQAFDAAALQGVRVAASPRP